MVRILIMLFVLRYWTQGKSLDWQCVKNYYYFFYNFFDPPPPYRPILTQIKSATKFKIILFSSIYIFLKNLRMLSMVTKMYIQLMLHPNNVYTSCIVGFLSADMAPVEYTLSNCTKFWVLSVLIKWTISDSPRLRKVFKPFRNEGKYLLITTCTIFPQKIA